MKVLLSAVFCFQAYDKKTRFSQFINKSEKITINTYITIKMTYNILTKVKKTLKIK